MNQCRYTDVRARMELPQMGNLDIRQVKSWWIPRGVVLKDIEVRQMSPCLGRLLAERSLTQRRGSYQ